MSAAETYFVVRDEEGSCLGWRDGLHGTLVLDYIGDNPPDINTERWMSRKESEDAAAEHGGTVQRVTVTTEDVGLRWEKHPKCAGKCLHWKLYDGTEFELSANTDADGVKWFLHDWAGDQFAGPFDTLEEAKAAAEAAVRETWT